MARAGMISTETLRGKRRYAILIAFIAAAILTPPDVISQCSLAIPLIILYEGSIFLVRAIEKKRAAREAAEENEEAEREAGNAKRAPASSAAGQSGEPIEDTDFNMARSE